MDKKPKIWKMMLVSWIFVYPLINIMFALLMPFSKRLPTTLKNFNIYFDISTCNGNINS